MVLSVTTTAREKKTRGHAVGSVKSVLVEFFGLADGNDRLH